MTNTRTNLDVRGFLAVNGVMHRTVAEAMGVSKSDLSAMMRYELSATEKRKIFEVAEQIIRSRGDEPKRIQII